MSRSSDFPSDTFAAASGSRVHLLRQEPAGVGVGGPGGAGGPGQPPHFSQVLVSHDCAINTVRWNRNNKVVASGCADGQIQLLYAKGEVMCVLPRDGTPPAALGSISSLSWSMGSKCLAAGSTNGSVYIFGMRGKQEELSLLASGHGGGVTALEYQHEDKFLAVASGDGSITAYSDPNRAGGGGGSSAVPLQASATDTSTRVCLSLAAGEPVLAAGSTRGGVAVWDVVRRCVREEYAGQHGSSRVNAVEFVRLRPGMLYSAGSDGRVVLQDRHSGSGHVSAFSVGAPATALMLKEDHVMLGVGTADGVVRLYDPRHTRHPVQTMSFPERQPITGLHWQHRYSSLSSRAHRSGTGTASGTASAAPARSGVSAGPSRLGMAASATPASSIPAAGAAAAAELTGGVAAAAAAPAVSFGSRIPPAAAPAAGLHTPAVAATAAAASAARAGKPGTPAAARAAAAAAGTPAAAVRAKLAALLQARSAAAAHSQLPGTDGRKSISAPGSRSPSPAVAAAGEPATGAVAPPASVQPRSISSHVQLTPQPAAAVAAAAAAAAHSTPQQCAAAAAGGHAPMAITPLPGHPPRYGGSSSMAAAPGAGEVTSAQQHRQQFGAAAAADSHQRLQQPAITPLSSMPHGRASTAAHHQQQQHAQSPAAAAANSPLHALAAAPMHFAVTPLVPPRPAGGILAAGAAAGPGAGQQRVVPPLPLSITPLSFGGQLAGEALGGGGGGGGLPGLAITPLPGMPAAGGGGDRYQGAAEPAAAASVSHFPAASATQRSVLGERTPSGGGGSGGGANFSHAAGGSTRHSMLPRLALPLPVEGEEAPAPLQASLSFSENLPSPGSQPGGGKQPGSARRQPQQAQQQQCMPLAPETAAAGAAAAEHKVKVAAVAAAGVTAGAQLSPAGSGGMMTWRIGAGMSEDMEVAEVAPPGAGSSHGGKDGWGSGDYAEPAGGVASTQQQARQQGAAAAAASPYEFSFAAAQKSLQQLSCGGGSGGGGSSSGGLVTPELARPGSGGGIDAAAALAAAAAAAAPADFGGSDEAAGAATAGAVAPYGLRDDILAMHLDMLQQFQAQQASMGQLVSQVLERNEALTAEVAALRKQLGELTGRRNNFLWL